MYSIMTTTTGVQYAIAIETDDNDRILLPPYHFRADAKLAASRLIEISNVASVKLLKMN